MAPNRPIRLFYLKIKLTALACLLGVEVQSDVEQVWMDKTECLAEHLLKATLGVEHQLDPALSARFSFDVILECIAYLAFAHKGAADKPVQKSCL